MYPDLPPHLQTLNTIPSSDSPPSAWNQEDEEGLWSFLRTDDIFGPSSDAHHPSTIVEEKASPLYVSPPAPTPAETPASVSVPASASASTSTANANHGVTAPTLESFLATFANSQQALPALPNNYLLPLPLPFPAGVNTSDVMPAPYLGNAGSEYGDDAQTKRLRKNGAGPAEIEEDKRRRNTEASARFRLKKKEREQALERRAKELESQVTTLQNEKQALTSENKLLKYLLLKTGTQPTGESGEGLADVLEGLGKRKREV